MKKANEIIRGLREDRDLRQSDIAKLIGTTQQHYSRCEKGECEFSARAITVLADYYMVSTDFLFGRTDCQGGVDSLNQSIISDWTTGQLITDVLSLSDTGRRAVIEYISLQKLKETVAKRKKNK